MAHISKIVQCTCALLFAGAGTAVAAEVGPCHQLDSISYLVGETRSFSKGAIRIAHVDTDGEPVCCSSHLIVIVASSEEPGSQCFALSQKAAAGADGDALGFADVAFKEIRASYDPRNGLLLTVPYTLYNPDGGKGTARSAKLRVDQRSSGSVRIEPEGIVRINMPCSACYRRSRQRTSARWSSPFQKNR